MKNPKASALSRALLLLLLPPALGLAQTTSLSVSGQSGSVPLVQINGRSYVDVESLARIANGSLQFQGNQLILTLPPSGANTSSDQPPHAASGFTKGFMDAGIEEMTVIREWRAAILNAVQSNNPVTDNWVSSYRRNAESSLALASAAAASDSDRKAFALLQNELANMQKLSSKYVQMRKNMEFTSTDSMDNDPLNQQILSCARGLASLASSGTFADVPACH